MISVFRLNTLFSVVGAPSTDLLVTYQTEFPLQQVFDGVCYGAIVSPKIHFDPNVTEAHERAHSYAAHDKGVRPGLMKQTHRSETAPMFVREILYHRHVADLVVFQFHKSKDFALSKMTGTRGFQAAGMHRRNCYLLVQYLNPFFIIMSSQLKSIESEAY